VAPLHKDSRHEKTILITYSEYVFVALVKAHARIMLSSVACSALPHFFRYLINGTIFGKNIRLNAKRVL
jgi:hypothetical protein